MDPLERASNRARPTTSIGPGRWLRSGGHIFWIESGRPVRPNYGAGAARDAAERERQEETKQTARVGGRAYSHFEPRNWLGNCASSWLYFPFHQECQGFSTFHGWGGWPHYEQRQPGIRCRGTTLPERKYL